MLAGHLVAAGGFALVCSYALRSNGSDGDLWRIWLWLIFGISALAFWLGALAPVRFWVEVWSLRKPTALILSSLIGLGIYSLALFAEQLWLPLSDLTLTTSKRLLRLFASDVVYNPATRLLGTRAFQVVIAPICSGFEGIGMVIGALGLFLVLFRKSLRFPHALLVLPIGLVAIWFYNVVRIVALILIGTHISATVAVGGFHSQAGWIGFALVTLGLAYVALHSPLTKQADPRATERKEAATKSRAAAYLLPMLSMIAAAMITAALSSGFDTLYPIKILIGLAVLAYFARVYQRLGWSWSWLAACNGILVFVMWLLLEPLTHTDQNQLVNGLTNLPAYGKTIWIAFRVFGSVAVVPLVEELAFRGFLLRRMTNINFETVDYRQTSRFAVFVSSILFGILHERWVAGTVAGICYSIAARRRGRLCDAVVAHAITNSLIAVDVLLNHAWQLWS
jgi:exosortase E/protease (VPEID-CTERM system)